MRAARSARDRPWHEYPIGTKAHAFNGGWWTRTEHGWKANGGDTFPTPGADAIGRCIELPITDEQIRELQAALRLDGEWIVVEGKRRWSRQDDLRACAAALSVGIILSKWTRETARAHCSALIAERKGAQ